MSYNESDKEEEKFEFTPEGEVLAYISLDQARVLAMEHARDHRDFYGRRYRRRELVWEVVGEADDEESYQIRLSYRPAGKFQGTPGTEQFVIDKTGQIRLRQLLDGPGISGCFYIRCDACCNGPRGGWGHRCRSL